MIYLENVVSAPIYKIQQIYSINQEIKILLP